LAVLFGKRQSQRPGWTGSGKRHVALRLLRFLEHERFQSGRRGHSCSDDEWQLCAEQELSGRSPTSTGDTESFTSTSDADSESAPNLTQVTGTYAGTPCRQPPGHSDRGCSRDAFRSFTDGCTVAGTLSPRAQGNVLSYLGDIRRGACRQGTETLTGVAFYDAATNRLYSAALNHARTTSYLFLGTKR
jgi:hypothetical protein